MRGLENGGLLSGTENAFAPVVFIVDAYIIIDDAAMNLNHGLVDGIIDDDVFLNIIMFIICLFRTPLLASIPRTKEKKKQ